MDSNEREKTEDQLYTAAKASANAAETIANALTTGFVKDNPGLVAGLAEAAERLANAARTLWDGHPKRS